MGSTKKYACFFIGYKIAPEVHTIIDYIQKNEYIDQAEGNTAALASAQSQQTGKYVVQAGTVITQMMGDNSGQVTINRYHESNAPDLSSTPAPSRESADVGIIIALKEEFSVLFAEIGPDSQVIRDPQTGEIYYNFTRNSTVATRPYNCIATFIGGMGPSRATLQAERMITRWNPKTIVLPGIAASLSSDARLGDIVVADQVDGYLENARANPNTDERRYDLAFNGEAYRTSNTLLREVQNFEFSAPDIFQAWQKETSITQHKLVEQAQRHKLIDTKLLREQAQIINGHIASGPVLGASQAFSDWLKGRDRKYLALEMEAIGLMTTIYHQASSKNTGTLILRAISDYGNEEKSNLDNVGEGVLRHYAMYNAIQLLWSFFAAGLLPQQS